ncbi:glycerate dehydrogenase [Actinocatenispora thailandica]|uniref:Glycerate dehydrogenase n=1 Tax=Actinocatenispora thailandica TaxID=227318 RepID=A0A7R7DJS3_9ACTN|nr:hydroxyacid dehydrogenase [Actinocatenispora thailandica]BCJ32717.1 glycerate dehydrogenase [Actinocatenispora thailandica]
MSERPVAVLAMRDDLVGQIFPSPVMAGLADAVDCDPGSVFTTAAAPPPALAAAQVLLTGWDSPRLDATVLAAAPKLRLVVHAAGSVKQLTTPELFAAGVAVSSAVAVNARPVAEFTVASIVLAARRVFRYAADYRAGVSRHGYPVGEDSGLYGLTVGVVGASQIGRLVLRMLAGYGVDLLVYDPFLTPSQAEELGATAVDLDTLCGRSDVVTVHAPELPETYRMIDERRLGLLRDGAVLVNTARGALVDTDALAAHCATGRIDAVLDVTDPEPLPVGHPLLDLPNVLVTPHLAGTRGRELRRFGEFVVAEVRRWLGGETLLGRVDPDALNRSA